MKCYKYDRYLCEPQRYFIQNSEDEDEFGLMDPNSWSRQGSEEEDVKQKDLRLNETSKTNRLYTTEKQ